MVRFGYALSSEEHRSNDLVRHARLAEDRKDDAAGGLWDRLLTDERQHAEELRRALQDQLGR